MAVAGVIAGVGCWMGVGAARLRRPAVAEDEDMESGEGVFKLMMPRSQQKVPGDNKFENVATGMYCWLVFDLLICEIS